MAYEVQKYIDAVNSVVENREDVVFEGTISNYQLNKDRVVGVQFTFPVSGVFKLRRFGYSEYRKNPEKYETEIPVSLCVSLNFRHEKPYLLVYLVDGFESTQFPLIDEKTWNIPYCHHPDWFHEIRNQLFLQVMKVPAPVLEEVYL